MQANKSIPPLAAAQTILICMIFGANGVAIKVSLTGIGPFTSAGCRFFLAATVISAWAWATGRRFAIPKGQIKHLLLLSINFTVQLSLFHLGLAKTHASRGALIVNAVPFFVLILAHFYIPGDRITLKKIVGMIIGFTGVTLVLTDFQSTSTDLRNGDLIILAATVLWAVNAVHTKAIIHHFQPFQLVLYPMVFSAPIFLFEGWLWDPVMIDNLLFPVLASLFYQSIICTSICFVIWSSLLKRYGASVLHTYIFIMPVTGVTAGGLILGEPITPNLTLAVILVATGISIVHIRSKRITPTLPVGKGC